MLQITCGRRRAARRASDDGAQIGEIRRIASCSCFSRWPFPIFNLFPGLLDLPFRQMQKQIGLMPCHSSVLTFLLLPIWATLQKWRGKKKEQHSGENKWCRDCRPWNRHSLAHDSVSVFSIAFKSEAPGKKGGCRATQYRLWFEQCHRHSFKAEWVTVTVDWPSPDSALVTMMELPNAAFTAGSNICHREPSVKQICC